MTDQFETNKNFIKAQEPFFLRVAKNGKSYVCPICGNGENGGDGDGLNYDSKRGKYHCFNGACGFDGDVLDLIGAFYGLESFNERYLKGCELYELNDELGYNADMAPQGVTYQPINTPSESTEEPYSPVLTINDYEPIEKSKAALKYLQSRGFNFSFLRDKNIRVERRNNGKPNIVIGYPADTEGYYFKRGTDPNKSFKQAAPGMKRRLYNAQVLSGSDPVFICEGELDALAIEQAGGIACALGSTSNIELLLKADIKAPVFLCLDNDNAGREATEKLTQELKTPYRVVNISGQYKDPAERLQFDESGLKIAIKAAVETYKPVKRKTLNEVIEQLFEAVQSGSYEPVKTGIKSLDELLDGGLINKTLTTISAAPGVGKTILSQEIAENLAKQGYSVLYACLEMSAEQMAARSLSRASFKENKLSAIPVNSVFKGANIKESTLKKINEFSGNITYLDTERSIEGILQAAKDIKQETGKAPYLFIDYLQLLQDKSKQDAAEKIKDALIALKSYVNGENVCAFVVVADNREAAKTGTSNLFSGRDTSAIEYSADYALSLSFTYALMSNSGLNIDEIRNNAELKSNVTLRVNKNRYGSEGGKLDLTMFGGYATFEPKPRRAI